jgi:hypothetical protein
VTEIGKSVKRRFPARAWALAGTGFVCLLAAAVLAVENSNSADPTHEATFKLRETPVFTAGQNDFLRGQMCRCQTEPFAAVLHYPAFSSQVPIYGSVNFGGRWDATNGGATFYFAVDESRGTGKGYDRLYFDRNRDLDLRNDPVANVPSTSPDGGYKPNFGGIKSVTCFDFLNVDLSTNGAGAARVEVMPRLLLTGSDTNTYRFMFFVRTHLFEGDVKIAGEKFHALLGNDYSISPDLNFPGTTLKLDGSSGSADWWGGDRISAMHKVNGHYYSFSASPDGALTVHPYKGDLGIFEAGPGFRPLTNFSVTGSLQASNCAVAIGGGIKDGRPEAARACEIPAGDYLPEFLTVQFGRLHIQLSQNYHSEGKRQSRSGRPDVYGLTVRKDRPCVLDFSTQPEVMFTSPTNSQRIQVGEELSVMAVLTDPKLDIMIRRLEDTAHKQTKDADGKDLGYERNVSLDPRVLITRANGEKVAEGVMPFG